MTFPERPYRDIAEYRQGYAAALAEAMASIDDDALRAAAQLIAEVHQRDGCMFACGNGGSTAIANHLLCDHSKGIATGTNLRPRVSSLSAHTELITAIGNDISFDEIFSHQLQIQARPGDLLLTISSSGNSENIVRAVQWANDYGMTTIALTGFGGGRCRELASVAVHVDAHNYGIIEDCHQSIMHLLAQFLHQAAVHGLS